MCKKKKRKKLFIFLRTICKKKRNEENLFVFNWIMCKKRKMIKIICIRYDQGQKKIYLYWTLCKKNYFYLIRLGAIKGKRKKIIQLDHVRKQKNEKNYSRG